MICHSLLQWTTFSQTSPPWPIRLGWPHVAWLIFIELDKVVVHVIRVASFLWLWFQCVCPLMPSRNTYLLTWTSLTLDMGYLFTAAPAKHSRFSLPQTWGSASQLPPLTLEVQQLLPAALLRSLAAATSLLTSLLLTTFSLFNQKQNKLHQCCYQNTHTPKIRKW